MDVQLDKAIVFSSPALQVMNQFEKHLREVERVSPRTPQYASSDYSWLVEAMAIAWLAKLAFVDKHFNTDVKSMLKKWLSDELCELFFDGNEDFYKEVREEMKSRAAKMYNTPNGQLQEQYFDVETAICESNPYSIHGGGVFR